MALLIPDKPRKEQVGIYLASRIHQQHVSLFPVVESSLAVMMEEAHGKG